MAIALPSRTSKTWTQNNKGDISGVVQRSRGMSFDSEGYGQLSKRARAIFTESSDADFTRPVAIGCYDPNGEYFIMTAGHLFLLTLAEAMTVADQSAVSNAPVPDSSGYSDLVPWQGYLYASGDSSSSGGIKRYNGSWSTRQYTLTQGGPMAVFESKNYLAVGQANTVILLDTSHTLILTLTLRTDFEVVSLDYSNGYMYIGTRHKGGGEAMLFQWDGNSAVANNGWPVGCQRINSVKRYNSSVALMTSDGRLLRFNGGGFEELGCLPIYYTDLDWDRPGSANLGRVIHRGMVVENDLILVNISPRIVLPNNDPNAFQFFNTFPGGVWCYDPKVGFYQRLSQSSSLRSRTDAIATTDVNTTTDVITVAGATVPDTGTPVIYDGANATVITGLTDMKKYYVINVSSSTLKLATTRANALAGTQIDLTGTGNNSQRLVFLPNRDFGASHPIGGDSATGDAGSAIALLRPTASAAIKPATGRRFIFGGQVGLNTITEKDVLCVAAANQENRGYIITVKIPSEVVKDGFQNFSLKVRNLRTPEDMVVAKWRTIVRADDLNKIRQNLSQTGTWTVLGSTSSQFTSTADLSAAKIGDEVEVVNGSGAGYLAHITAVSVNAGTYTITIDEPIQNAAVNDTMLFMIELWVKSGTISTSDCDQFQDSNGTTHTGDGAAKTFGVNQTSKWLELKLELRGEDVAIEEIFINKTPLRELI